MSMISELVNKLRFYEAGCKGAEFKKVLGEAANTIEEQGAKLQRLNMERSSQYYNNGWIPVDSGILPKKDGRYTVTEEIYSLNNKRKVIGKRVSHDVQFDVEEQRWHRANTLKVIAWKENEEPYNPDVPVTNVGHKTNADKIRSMSDEELVDKIFEMDEPPKFVLPFCGNSDRCTDILESDELSTDEMCRQCLMDWLKAESEG